jgi:hypothetical protein
VDMIKEKEMIEMDDHACATSIFSLHKIEYNVRKVNNDIIYSSKKIGSATDVRFALVNATSLNELEEKIAFVTNTIGKHNITKIMQGESSTLDLPDTEGHKITYYMAKIEYLDNTTTDH